VGRPQGKRSLGGSGYRRKDNISRKLAEMGVERVYFYDPAQNMDK
jgi:hypothetical protein